MQRTTGELRFIMYASILGRQNGMWLHLFFVFIIGVCLGAIASLALGDTGTLYAIAALIVIQVVVGVAFVWRATKRKFPGLVATCRR